MGFNSGLKIKGILKRGVSRELYWDRDLWLFLEEKVTDIRVA
jgi:hypothetical protein